MQAGLQETFVKYFVQAQEEVLDPKESRVVELRYGFTNGEPRTLDQIGHILHLTRARIHQILKRAHLIIRCTGRRQINRGETTKASACLLLYLEEIIRPEEPGHLERIFAFARENLAALPLHTHAFPLLVFLFYGEGERGKHILSQLLQMD